MKKVFLILAVLFFTQPVSQTFAATDVKVSIPSFNVTINDQEEDHQYSQYPFIVYKNITYVPMTYYNCSMLGLESCWDADSGLTIVKRDPQELGRYAKYVASDTVNAAIQHAETASGKVLINGKYIDNSNEEYPILTMNEIVYFPLTWRFAVEEFGWRYEFSDADGLVIQADSKFHISANGLEGLYYFRDEMKIYIDTNSQRAGLGGPPTANLYVTRSGVEKTIGVIGTDNFGYDIDKPDTWSTGKVLDVDGEWIYTSWGSYWEGTPPRRCKVNMSTEEIVLLDDEKTF